ncbi:MAG: hypothetical protein ACJAZ1_002746 [Yoonia sp.]|jgi:hypothetical protein
MRLTKLTALFVKSAPPGKHEDGNGLRLIKRKDVGGQWVFRYAIHGQRRETGLGGISAVSLKDAREIATGLRAAVAHGIDPNKKRAQEQRHAERSMHLLKDVALDAFESRKAELKGDVKAGRWFSPLELHVLPKLSDLPITELDRAGHHR